MLAATIERELNRLVEELKKERGAPKLGLEDIQGRPYLKRVARYVQAFFELRLEDCPQYRALVDLQQVRNCIVHRRGEVPLSQDKGKGDWVNLKNRRPGLFAHEGFAIVVESECIEQFIKETWAFFIWCFDKLKWKVAERWRGTKWWPLPGGTEAVETNT